MEWNHKRPGFHTLTARTLDEFVAFTNRPDHAERAEAFGRNQSEKHKLAHDWCMSTPIEQAQRLAGNREVWTDGAAQINGLAIQAAQKIQGMIGARKTVFAETGARPHIARFCAGEPRHMMRTKAGSERARPGLNIVLNRFMAHWVKSDTVMALSAAATAFAVVMDRKGYRVRAHVGWIAPGAMGGRKKGLAMTAPLFSPAQPLNMARLAYFGAHPAAPRRTMFRAVEMGGERLKSFTEYGMNDVAQTATERARQLKTLRQSMGLSEGDKLVILPGRIDGTSEEYCGLYESIQRASADKRMAEALEGVIEQAKLQGVEV